MANTTCPKPTLTKFEGKWDQLSPQASLLAWLGYDKPFDRHDWTVNRCGTDVVYIIDYYAQTNRHGFHIDARPALTLGGMFDRARVAARHSQQAAASRVRLMISLSAAPRAGRPSPLAARRLLRLR